MCAKKAKADQQQGFVLIFCLLTMGSLSLLALSALQQAAMVDKQVASFKLAEEVDNIEILVRNAAITSLNHTKNYHSNAVDIHNKEHWHRLDLPASVHMDGAASYYIQQLSQALIAQHSPKITSAYRARKSRTRYVYRITYAANINSSYERLGQFDYIKVEDE